MLTSSGHRLRTLWRHLWRQRWRVFGGSRVTAAVVAIKRGTRTFLNHDGWIVGAGRRQGIGELKFDVGFVDVNDRVRHFDDVSTSCGFCYTSWGGGRTPRFSIDSDNTQLAPVLFSQLSAAVVRHAANDGVVYAISAWFKFDTALPGVVLSYRVLAYWLQPTTHWAPRWLGFSSPRATDYDQTTRSGVGRALVTVGRTERHGTATIAAAAAADVLI